MVNYVRIGLLNFTTDKGIKSFLGTFLVEKAKNYFEHEIIQPERPQKVIEQNINKVSLMKNSSFICKKRNYFLVNLIHK